MAVPKYDGVTMKLGGEDYVLPPLNMARVKKIIPLLEKLQTVKTTMEEIDIVIEVIHLGLSRNYPDITKEDIAELIDLGNAKEVIEALLLASGFARKSGEALAGNGPIGTPSMPT
jgi:hypothetical protein